MAFVGKCTCRVLTIVDHSLYHWHWVMVKKRSSITTACKFQTRKSLFKFVYNISKMRLFRKDTILKLVSFMNYGCFLLICMWAFNYHHFPNYVSPTNLVCFSHELSMNLRGDCDKRIMIKSCAWI
jgi:hypothetical protein